MSTWWAPRSSKPLSVSDPYRGWFDSFPLRHFSSSPMSVRGAGESCVCNEAFGIVCCKAALPGRLRGWNFGYHDGGVRRFAGVERDVVGVSNHGGVRIS